MLGLDAWNGSKEQVKGFSAVGGITFPMLLNAGSSAPASYENFVVVRPNGTTLPVIGGLSSSSVTQVEGKVNELLAQIPPPAPAISVQQTAIDFGTIVAGQTGEQAITIQNTGTASLEITGIESDVSGVTFEPSTFTVAPNGSQTVTITFPGSTAGTFSGNITISSNDPDRATQTLSVSVIVQPPPVPAISVQQTAVDFGTVAFAQTVQQMIAIQNTGTAPLEITGIESNVPGLSFSPSMFTLDPNGSQTVTITFPKPMEGEFSGRINILSNDPDRAKHTLTISGVVQPLSLEARSDFSRDGTIDFTDFLLFVGAFGSAESEFDIDGSGAVDFNDFLLFVSVFGKTVDG